MKLMHSEWQDRVKHWVRTLRDDFYEPLGEIRWEAFRTMDHLSPEEALQGHFTSVEPGFIWGKTWEYCWFKGTVILPKAAEGKRIVMNLDAGGESTVFVNGKAFGNYRAAWVDEPHQFIEDNCLAVSGKEGDTYEILMETYAGHFYPEAPTGGCATGPVLPGAYTDPKKEGARCVLGTSTFGVWNEDAYQLFMDVDTLGRLLETMDSTTLRAAKIAKALEKFTLIVDFEQPREARIASYKEAREALRPLMEAKNGSTMPVFYAIGNAHLDLAWLWPMEETHRKTERTFAAQLRLIEQYPEYKYVQSQPAAYEMCRKYYPELFERIKEAIKGGQWIADGAMWVEPDTNMASGEALIRQLVHGKRYYKEELGVDSEVLWLPDTFGYTAALPQILKGCGVNYLVTQKIFWSYNEGEQFPYHYFTWQGMDGSEIDSFLPTSYTYRTHPSEVNKIWQNRVQVQDLDAFLLTFGYGDGGGGPARDFIESAKRQEDLEGSVKVKMAGPLEFFHDMEAQGGPANTYVGELYFSAHRGTYTSQAKNKKYNRICEFMMADAEFYSVLANGLGNGYEYPEKELEKNWKLLLLNQFHDILPGSSIKDVYEDSAVQYEEILRSAGRIAEGAGKAILSSLKENGNNKEGLAVFNPLSFRRTSAAELSAEEARWAENGLKGGCPEGMIIQRTGEGGMLILVKDAPSKGLGVYENSVFDIQAEEPVIRSLVTDERGWPISLDTPFFHMEFDPQGEISCIRDLRESRELLKKGAVGNELIVYEDRPMEFDAWNIDAGYREKKWKFGGVTEFYLEENGPVRGSLLIRRHFLDSVLEQRICFYSHTARIDFKTKADWRESQLLLRTSFPLDIQSNEADFEIQFGNVKRPVHQNTTWDQARFEVCAHKWMDLSEYGYGAAVLNDCKYGCDIHDSVMSLTLIKSGIFPDPQADQGLHEFTYSLYPHRGDFRRGRVIQEAYDLNCPLTVQKQSGIKKGEWSFLQISEENIFADTVKKAEEGDDLIIRLYEAYGMRTRVHLVFPLFSDFDAAVCDLMEQTDQKTQSFVSETELVQKGQTLEFEMKPYEIFSIRLTPKCCR